MEYLVSMSDISSTISKPSSSSLNDAKGELSLAVYSDILDTACLHLRILTSAQQLGWKVLRGITEEGFDASIVEQADAVVIQRDHCRIMRNYESVTSLAHQRGIPVIFDLDDLLFELPEEHPDRVNGFFADALLPMLLTVIEADLVTVTTNQLRDYLLPYNPNTVVLPNYLDDVTWQMKTPIMKRGDGEPLIIGYMGTDSHEPDLREILPALLQVAEKYPGKVAFRFWGIQPPQELIQAAKVEWNPHPTFTYVDFVRNFQEQSADIAIAPLQDNLFNACKSPLKFFEYSANGIPGVYSRVAPYEGVITDRKEGLLASTTEQWVNALSALIESSELRMSIITKAQASLRENWLLSDHANAILDAYTKTITSAKKRKRILPKYAHLLRGIADESDKTFRDLKIENDVLTQDVKRNEFLLKDQQKSFDYLLIEKERFLQAVLYEQKILEKDIEGLKEVIAYYSLSLSWTITRPFRKITQISRKVKMKLKEIRDYFTIKKSGLFDSGYYLLVNLDVRLADVDPLWHYIRNGWREGRNPNAEFNIDVYLANVPELRTQDINPLIHYLAHSKDDSFLVDKRAAPGILELKPETHTSIGQVMTLFYDSPQIPSVHSDRPIDILIPVYNRLDLLQILLKSILKNTSIPYRLLIANDHSREEGITEFLEHFKHQNPQVEMVILENEENLGYLKTINKLAELTRGHFVILNTDTEVPPHWLERLMAPIFNEERVASTTPFTNSGTICSFPKFLYDNPLFAGLDVQRLDAYFQLVDSNKLQTEIPTAVGFCAGINWNLYKQIGMFNEVFGKGYGEENDWCMRAGKLGYRNLIVPNLFVYHKHGASFAVDVKERLIGAHLQELSRMHPDYLASVEKYINIDPLRHLRPALMMKILSGEFGAKLILDHNQGGGANLYTRLSNADRHHYLTITEDLRVRGYTLSSIFEGQPVVTFPLSAFADLNRIVKFFAVSELAINELVAYPNVLEAVDILLKVKQDNRALNYTYYLHDYFCICPHYTLLNYERKYCGVPEDLAVCDACLRASNKNSLLLGSVALDYKELGMSEWRSHFGMLLSNCNRIICFSGASKDLIVKAYPALSDHIEVIPHKVNWVRETHITKTSTSINLAVLGNINFDKGAEVVYALAEYIEHQAVDMRIHIFGNLAPPYDGLFKEAKCVVLHNAYVKAELPELMEKNEIDLVLIPSIWPETFSYTTEEAMQMGIPVAVFDLGAPAERVKKYAKGLILVDKKPEYFVPLIEKFLNKDNK